MLPLKRLHRFGKLLSVHAVGRADLISFRGEQLLQSDNISAQIAGGVQNAATVARRVRLRQARQHRNGKSLIALV